MRSSVAARCNTSFSRFISLLCAVTLCCGLVPSAAFAAADDSLSLIPEGEQGAAPIVSGAEGGSDDAVSHSASDGASSVDGGGAASTSEDVNDSNFINQDTELTALVAQGESSKSFFLAQALESTRVIPVASAKLPIDTNAPEKTAADYGEEVFEENGNSSLSSNLGSESTLVGSFAYHGITYAVEPGGVSVAIVAADYNQLSSDYVSAQTIVLPSRVSANGIDYYSVTRIADGAFASFVEENSTASTNLDAIIMSSDNTGDEVPASIMQSESVATVVSNEDDEGVIAITIPASITAIDENAFTGFDTLQYVIVSADNPSYSMRDGCLYDKSHENLVLVPEGREVIAGNSFSDGEEAQEYSYTNFVYESSSSVTVGETVPFVEDKHSSISFAASDDIVDTTEPLPRALGTGSAEVLKKTEAADGTLSFEVISIEIFSESTTSSLSSVVNYSAAPANVRSTPEPGIYAVPLHYSVHLWSGARALSELGGRVGPVAPAKSASLLQSGNRIVLDGSAEAAFLPNPTQMLWSNSRPDENKKGSQALSLNSTSNGTLGAASQQYALVTIGGVPVNLDNQETFNGRVNTYAIYNWNGSSINNDRVWRGISYSDTIMIHEYPFAVLYPDSGKIVRFWLRIGEQAQVAYPDDENMIFVGWFDKRQSVTDPYAEGNYYCGGIGTRTGSLAANLPDLSTTISLYAHYMPSGHDVVFDANGGAHPDSGVTTPVIWVEHGKAMPRNLKTGEKVNPANNLYAKPYNLATQSYETAANASSKTLISTVATTRAGYRFDGYWNTPSVMSGTTIVNGREVIAKQYYDADMKPLGSWTENDLSTTRLYAHWIKMDNHAVTLSGVKVGAPDMTVYYWPERGYLKTNAGEGATVVSKNSAFVDTSVIKASVPGYTFIGYYDKPQSDPSAKVMIDQAGILRVDKNDKDILEDTSFNAHWSENRDYSMEFKTKVAKEEISLCTRSNLWYETQSFTVPTASDIPEVRGYALLGWSKTDPGTNVYSQLSDAPGEKYPPGVPLTIKSLYGANPISGTLFAIYALNSYILTIDHQGGSFSTESLSKIRSDVGASNVSEADGKTILRYTVRTQDFTVPASENKSGFTFSKWLTGSADSPSIAPSSSNFALDNYAFVADWTPICSAVVPVSVVVKVDMTNVEDQEAVLDEDGYQGYIESRSGAPLQVIRVDFVSNPGADEIFAGRKGEVFLEALAENSISADYRFSLDAYGSETNASKLASFALDAGVGKRKRITYRFAIPKDVLASIDHAHFNNRTTSIGGVSYTIAVAVP